MQTILHLAAALAAATCTMADRGVHPDDAFSALLEANAGVLIQHLHTEEHAQVLGSSSRNMAEKLCPQHFTRTWL